MIDIVNKVLCSGCMACSNICPVNAIAFVHDNKGFWYPKIDSSKCINCNLCDKVCQTLHNQNLDVELKAFATVNKNSLQRSMSQSGGLFSALATVVLNQNGVVYGATLNSDFRATQIRITHLEELPLLQGSKYIQSIVGDTFKQVKNDLLSGKTVLYSGTSCMIGGLLLYLQVSNTTIENLYTADLICHGVNSPLIYHENLKFIEKKHNKKIKNMHFRHPKYGWHSHVEYYEFEDGSTDTSILFPDLFYSDVMLRDSCYNCKFGSIESKVSDITMADFWGIEKILPDFCNDNKGISLAIIRSKKGDLLFKQANLISTLVEPSIAVSKNVNSAAKYPVHTPLFWKAYWDNGYEYALKKWSIYGGTKFKIKRKIMRKLKKW